MGLNASFFMSNYTLEATNFCAITSAEHQNNDLSPKVHGFIGLEPQQLNSTKDKNDTNFLAYLKQKHGIARTFAVYLNSYEHKFDNKSYSMSHIKFGSYDTNATKENITWLNVTNTN